MDKLPELPEAAKADIPVWKKAAEIFTDFIKLTKSVEKIKKENEALSREILSLRRQLDSVEGQLSVLLTFVQNALDDRVEARSRKIIEQELEKRLKK